VAGKDSPGNSVSIGCVGGQVLGVYDGDVGENWPEYNGEEPPSELEGDVKPAI
jgi:hypothetical protein